MTVGDTLERSDTRVKAIKSDSDSDSDEQKKKKKRSPGPGFFQEKNGGVTHQLPPRVSPALVTPLFKVIVNPATQQCVCVSTDWRLSDHVVCVCVKYRPCQHYERRWNVALMNEPETCTTSLSPVGQRQVARV